MLWNWDVTDSCFLAASWHITTGGTFAATCIGVILLVILVEFTRRLSREYDELLLRQFSRQATRSRTNLALRSDQEVDGSVSAVITLRASPLQQFIRAVLYAATVAGAYILMLIAMSFNGYVIICIFIGAGIGKFLCDWLVVKVDLRGTGPNVKTHLKEGGEAAVCCA